MKSSNSYGTEHNLEEYPIGYTDVIEKFQDGSYIHYQYSSWTNKVIKTYDYHYKN